MATTPAPALSFDDALAMWLKSGWKITSDGPSGVQLEGPRKMKTLDKVCLVFGMLTFWMYGIGLFFIAIALIDYYALTKPEQQFLQRPSATKT